MSGYSPDQAPIPDPNEGWEEEQAEEEKFKRSKTAEEKKAEAAFEAWLDSLPDIEF